MHSSDIYLDSRITLLNILKRIKKPNVNTILNIMLWKDLMIALKVDNNLTLKTLSIYLR